MATSDRDRALREAFRFDGSDLLGSESEIVTGASTTAQFTAKPGKYTYYCTLPGHEEAGMKGTLTIK